MLRRARDRSLRRLASLALALLAVAGCTAAGPDPASPPAAWSPRTPTTATPAPAASARPTSASPSTSRPARSWTMVGLGDSVMAGTACDCAGVVDAYAALLRQGDPGLTVRTRNLGIGGATSGDLQEALADDPDTRAAVASADVVVVTSGANDLAERLDPAEDAACDAGCLAGVLEETRAHLTGALGEIRDLRDGRPTTVLVTGYWNDFEDGDAGLQEYGHAGLLWARNATASSNAAIRDAAAAAGATYVDLVVPFLGADGGQDPTPLLAQDGDHPNRDGVAVMAAALAAAYRG